jgi:hypothetical protein
MIKFRRMGWQGMQNVWEKNAYRVLVGIPEETNLDTDVRITLKYTLDI